MFIYTVSYTTIMENTGYTMLVAGVDEAGRGPLIGPVVAAAVVLPSDDKFPDDMYLSIKDSKKLSIKKREVLADYIRKHAITYGIGVASPQEIDQINILHATMRAMERALTDAYKKQPFHHIMVDGQHFTTYIPPGIDSDALTHECIVDGDNIHRNIGAASILAKTHHDMLIRELIEQNPDYEKYGLKKNMGYGTAEHIRALRQYGATPHHRRSFKPVSLL
ncbi:ribonuclease HII [Dishui Lake large algae virus 1]|nr:ribonuclease HII [Dishui Lake large algae virus 1]